MPGYDTDPGAEPMSVGMKRWGWAHTWVPVVSRVKSKVAHARAQEGKPKSLPNGGGPTFPPANFALSVQTPSNYTLLLVLENLIQSMQSQRACAEKVIIVCAFLVGGLVNGAGGALVVT